VYAMRVHYATCSLIIIWLIGYVWYCVSASSDGDGGIKPVKRCSVQLDNQLKIIYNWAAPEVLFGQPFSFLSDVYSLCAVLWEAVKGSVCMICLLSAARSTSCLCKFPADTAITSTNTPVTNLIYIHILSGHMVIILDMSVAFYSSI